MPRPRRTPEPFSLRHRKYFPIFAEIPTDDDIYTADCHYCLLVEIVEIVPYLRPTFRVKDKADREFIVMFYLDRGTEVPREEWKTSCRVGGVMMIKGAMNHQFMDGQVGVRVEDVEDVKMLPCNLQALLHISDEVTKPGAPETHTKCYLCEKPADLKCSRCVVRYCDKGIGSF
ncbi:hypothetical protein CPC08DRAFT_712468, partial [Agrocybe pediades]